ncbi:MAG: hypothetical protein C4549_07510 [Deltaproteobacteria bacterium]|jgi:hypothetical protein|nr:MAG: hypothetical protein C4549_07510 [Deltaproteobacteria bacterium]
MTNTLVSNWKNILASKFTIGLLYPAVLGGIIYAALPPLFDSIFSGWWPSLKSLTLLAIVFLYSSDYTYTVFYTTKEPSKYTPIVTLGDIGIVLTLFVAAATLFETPVVPYCALFYALAASKFFTLIWDKIFHGAPQRGGIDFTFLGIYLLLAILLSFGVIVEELPNKDLSDLKIRYLPLPFLWIPLGVVTIDTVSYIRFLLKKAKGL